VHGADEGYDADGFVFYSHIASQKVAARRKSQGVTASLKSLRRQVRIRGNVSPDRSGPTPISPPG
jgi:pyridoxamine 5'-phosphate oxidase